MPPPFPKRPPPPPPNIEFDEEEVLQADDPRPQHVSQYPSGPTARRLPRRAEEAIPTLVYSTGSDEELRADYGVVPEPSPIFAYVEKGPGQGQLIELKQGTVVVGRASVADLKLFHPSISRRHAQLRRLGEALLVKDLGSQNGTYVNKERIAHEVEVRPGDSVAVGNAVLRIRGPLKSGEHDLPPHALAKEHMDTALVARPPPAARGRSTTRSSRALTVAVFAGAVGFGLAAALAIALVRLVTAEPAPVATAQPPAERPAPSPSRAAPRPVETFAAEEPVAAAEAPVSAEPRVSPVRAPARVRPGPARRAPPRPQAARAVAEPSVATSTVSAEEAPARLLVAYERGDAAASLDAARKAGAVDLARRLDQFIAAYDEGSEALVANDGPRAIQALQKALLLDQSLASGWGRYAQEIRKRLSNLHVLAGIGQLAQGNRDAALKAFQSAASYDPANERAREQLARLKSAPVEADPDQAFEDAPPPTSRRAPDAPSRIDEAFDEEGD